MKKRVKNLFSTLGAIALVLGVAIAIPSWVNANYFGFGISIFFVIIGAILLSIGFGD